MAGGHGEQRGLRLRAFGRAEHAAGVEAAAGRQAAGGGDGALDGEQAVAGLLQPGHAAEQAERVGVLGIVEQRGGGRALHHAAGVHHGDLVRHLRHHAEVMGDQHDRHAGLALQVAQQVQDLRLHRHVQRGGGLVGDQQVGRAGQGHRDHHALAHAAGHLVRILVQPAVGGGDADAVQRVGGAAAQVAGAGGRGRASPPRSASPTV